MPRPVRIAFIDGDEDPYFQFSPDAPTDQITPVAPRASPYSGPPMQCTMNARTGQITCLSQQDVFLDSSSSAVPSQCNCSVCNMLRSSYGQLGGIPVSGWNNAVYGSNVVPGPIDSPLNRVLTRGPQGPWKMVGYAVTNDPDNTEARDRTMQVYAAALDRSRNRYNYRVTDSNGIPLVVEEKADWKYDGDQLSVPGQPTGYTLTLYDNYK